MRVRFLEIHPEVSSIARGKLLLKDRAVAEKPTINPHFDKAKFLCEMTLSAFPGGDVNLRIDGVPYHPFAIVLDVRSKPPSYLVKVFVVKANSQGPSQEEHQTGGANPAIPFLHPKG